MKVSYSKEELWPVYRLSENVDPVFVIDISESLWEEYLRAEQHFAKVQRKIKQVIFNLDGFTTSDPRSK